MIDRILIRPTKIFLLDSLGALLTTIIIGVVLTNFQEYIGMPLDILFTLAGVALIFCVYSISCFVFLKKNWKPFLKAIAIANLLYCLATTVLIITFYPQLTILGLLYFIGEIIVIVVLVYFEFLVLNRTKNP
jgi:amino acid transporter